MSVSVKINLSKHELEKIDALVSRGKYLNRSDAIHAGVKTLLEKEEIDASVAESKVNWYLTLYVGDRLYAGDISAKIIDNQNVWEVLVMAPSETGPKNVGKIYVHRQTREIMEYSDKAEDIKKRVLELEFK
ncbi:MAG: ribbon-helix-helix domain-containing protein [Methanosarcinales archaeon]